jgi:hypothetical protein
LGKHDLILATAGNGGKRVHTITYIPVHNKIHNEKCGVLFSFLQASPSTLFRMRAFHPDKIFFFIRSSSLTSLGAPSPLSIALPVRGEEVERVEEDNGEELGSRCISAVERREV